MTCTDAKMLDVRDPRLFDVVLELAAGFMRTEAGTR